MSIYDTLNPLSASGSTDRGTSPDPGGSWFRQDKSADTQDCLSDG